MAAADVIWNGLCHLKADPWSLKARRDRATNAMPGPFRHFPAQILSLGLGFQV